MILRSDSGKIYEGEVISRRINFIRGFASRPYHRKAKITLARSKALDTLAAKVSEINHNVQETTNN